MANAQNKKIVKLAYPTKVLDPSKPLLMTETKMQAQATPSNKPPAPTTQVTPDSSTPMDIDTDLPSAPNKCPVGPSPCAPGLKTPGSAKKMSFSQSHLNFGQKPVGSNSKPPPRARPHLPPPPT